MQNQINTQAVYELLKSSNWYYEYCGSTPDSATMQGYINQIKAEITLQLVLNELESSSEAIMSDFDSDSDTSIEEFAADYIADSIGFKITKCIYEGVIFKG